MRTALMFVLLTALAAAAQPVPVVVPKDPDPRYGVQPKLKIYPQTTAKQALGSVIEAVEKGDFTYLTAHLLDPGFVDQRVAERGKTFEAVVEIELTRLRDFQNANPDRFEPADRLPRDREQFLAVVIERSRDRGFKQFSRDVEGKLRDDPQTLKDFKKIFRDGAITDEATGARATHPMVKEKTLFFKKAGDRWFLENRQTDEPARKEP